VQGRVVAHTKEEAIEKARTQNIWLAPVQPWKEVYWWEYCKKI